MAYMMESQSILWNTPRDLFATLNDRFHFSLDPCCTHESAVCEKHYTPVENGLAQSWKGERVFMNPPYGKELGDWCKKAYEESVGGCLVVGLIPARTDTKWWHEYIKDKATVIFIKGRIKYGLEGHESNSAPFQSVLVIWTGLDSLGWIA